MKNLEHKSSSEILASVGAIVTDDHFVYKSGRHGSVYVNKDALYPYTQATSVLCERLAEPFSILENMIHVVVAPAIGGVILSTWTAHHLSLMQGNTTLSVYAEKAENDTFIIKRGYDKLIADKEVLIVEDVLTTGDSAKKVVDAVKAFGGRVRGVSVLYNRGNVTKETLGVPRLRSLLDFAFEMIDEAECARTGLCAKGVPINTSLGHGREFLARTSNR